MKFTNRTCVCKGQEIDFAIVIKIIEKYRSKEGPLFPILREIQEIYNFIPEPVVKIISDKLGIRESRIYGVITFFSQFRTSPSGKNLIKVCIGTACHVLGAEGILDAVKKRLGVEVGETTGDGMFTIKEVSCFGMCDISPVMMINDEVFGSLTPKDAVEKIDEFLENKHGQE